MTHDATLVFRQGQEVVRTPVLKGAGPVLVAQGAPPSVGELQEFSIEAPWLPARAVRGAGRTAHVGASGSGVFALRMVRLASGAGASSLKELLRLLCGLELRDSTHGKVERIGQYWWVEFGEEGVLPRLPRLLPTEVQARIEESSTSELATTYLRQPITYVANNVPYPGRAVRLTGTSLVVHTNAVLPPLGAHVHVQFALDCGVVDRYAVMRGGVARRADDCKQGGWKGRFDLKIYDVEDLECPGVFWQVLDQGECVRPSPFGAAVGAALLPRD